MTLTDFMFAADVLRQEDGLSFHVETAPGVTAPAVPSPADVKNRNAQSMAMLQGMMGGVSKKKGARR